MGSKARLAKYILPIILEGRQYTQTFYDVCCGGGNLIENVLFGRRVGIDNNVCVIEALKLIRDNPHRLPKDNTETNEVIYKQMKTSGDMGLRGYYAFSLSYGGKYFGGWRKDSLGKRDYVKEAYKNALAQSGKLQGIEFLHANYWQVKYDDNSLIYIDPPYQSTTKYATDFDHKVFWEWCREMKKQGHTLFISEYSAPDDFQCVFEKELVSSLTKDTGSKKAIDRLFTI